VQFGSGSILSALCAYHSALKMEAVCPPEILASYKIYGVTSLSPQWEPQISLGNGHCVSTVSWHDSYCVSAVSWHDSYMCIMSADMTVICWLCISYQLTWQLPTVYQLSADMTADCDKNRRSTAHNAHNFIPSDQNLFLEFLIPNALNKFFMLPREIQYLGNIFAISHLHVYEQFWH
jgi:hypothetical protein